ncbi:MAG TPA: DUF309 domain-containing protein [Terriglobia bacterium]|nr:DUF309 domain-containing protein [Terriglobia bacterium]
MKQKVAEGIHLFNSQKFFEAHEALEEVWLKTEGKEKILLHGLIQVAAAFHHHSKSNSAGFRSLLEKGLSKLNQFGEVAHGVNLASLRQQIEPWREHLSVAHPSHSAQGLILPKIGLKE